MRRRSIVAKPPIIEAQSKVAECSEQSEERIESPVFEAQSKVAECPDDVGIGMYRSAGNQSIPVISKERRRNDREISLCINW